MATETAAPATSATPGHNTVYVRNLAEHVKPEVWKEYLPAVFSRFGTILDIVAKGSLKRKGQAFVVYEQPEAAQQALEVNGFELAGKPMRVELARSDSDAVVQKYDTPENFELHKRRRLAEKDRKQAQEALTGPATHQQQPHKRGAPDDAHAARPAKQIKSAANPAANTVVPDEYLPANKILFVQNFPDDYDVDTLTAMFGRYGGFKEVRLVPGRKGLAFVEYETTDGAVDARRDLANIALGDHGKTLKVTYQRQ